MIDYKSIFFSFCSALFTADHMGDVNEDMEIAINKAYPDFDHSDYIDWRNEQCENDKPRAISDFIKAKGLKEND